MSSTAQAIAADLVHKFAELELDQEHAGELGRAGDRRRPGGQPAELELDREHAGELGCAGDRRRPGVIEWIQLSPSSSLLSLPISRVRRANHSESVPWAIPSMAAA